MMGIGFVVIIALLAVLLGMFARQALANIDPDNEEEYREESPLSPHNPGAPGQSPEQQVM